MGSIGILQGNFMIVSPLKPLGIEIRHFVSLVEKTNILPDSVFVVLTGVELDTVIADDDL